jgi:hypothetical protein
MIIFTCKLSHMHITFDKLKFFLFGIVVGVAMQALLWWLLPAQIKLVTVISLMFIMIMNCSFDLYAKIKDKGLDGMLNAGTGTIGGAFGMMMVLIIQSL